MKFQVYSLQEKQTLMKNEINTRMTAEADARLGYIMFHFFRKSS